MGWRILSRFDAAIMPERIGSFSAARYGQQDHIEEHDDQADTEFVLEDGTTRSLARDIACIYYLTKGWCVKCLQAVFDCSSLQDTLQLYLVEGAQGFRRRCSVAL
jgi:hypothetical protein